ncbi:MAG: hypothetical protein IPP12_12660 [Nitrospira sp.]|nr:hypothetical protein [Nitrospira sp.]
MPEDPIVAIVGNVTTSSDAPEAAEALGRELAKAGLRILVYSSGVNFLEGHIVKGYVASRLANRRSVQVRYPLHGPKPEFLEQQTNGEVFDWRPDHSQDWEMSFYQSLNEVNGILLMGGGESTKIAGMVAMGHGVAMLPLAGFSGATAKVWESLRPGRDLPTADEISLMARPGWSDDYASECVKMIKDQLARKAELARQRRIEERRKEISVGWHALSAVLVFILAVASGAIAFAWEGIPDPQLIVLLFFSPLLAGVAGSTIRLVFDASQGAAPLTTQTTLTTVALGLIAGGAAGLLFITAQLTTAPTTGPQLIMQVQARKLVLFGVLIGLVAGLTLDAVFRKLISTDVVNVSAIEAKKGP